jgi:hypothetical protein
MAVVAEAGARLVLFSVQGIVIVLVRFWRILRMAQRTRLKGDLARRSLVDVNVLMTCVTVKSLCLVDLMKDGETPHFFLARYGTDYQRTRYKDHS